MKNYQTRVSSYGLVRKSERLLLCRVSAVLPRWKGQWTLPGGGVDFGEHPDDAMVREVMEETGVHVKPRSILTVDSLHDDSQDDADFHGIRLIYSADYLGGELRYETDGTTDYCQWCSREEIRKLPLVDIAVVGVRISFGD